MQEAPYSSWRLRHAGAIIAECVPTEILRGMALGTYSVRARPLTAYRVTVGPEGQAVSAQIVPRDSSFVISSATFETLAARKEIDHPAMPEPARITPTFPIQECGFWVEGGHLTSWAIRRLGQCKRSTHISRCKLDS